MLPRVPALVVIVVLAIARVAGAHPLDLGYLRINQTGPEVAVTLDLDVNAAANLLGKSSIDGQTVGALAAALVEASYAGAPIRTDEGPCRWGAPSSSLSASTVQVASTAICPGSGERRWALRFLDSQRISSRFELLVKEQVGDSLRLTVLSAKNFTLILSAASARGGGFYTFLRSGIEHIGVAPEQWRDTDGSLRLPDGIDHILFLIGLMLAGGRLWQLVGIASGFTLGHSMTLAIAATGLARPPAAVIEPLIALSIALVAVEALTGRFSQHRWKVATGFGLIHGFGFANALTDLDLSSRELVTALFGYNLGVELGQVVIVVIIAPLVLLAHRDARWRQYLVNLPACAIGGLGLYWFVERIGG